MKALKRAAGIMIALALLLGGALLFIDSDVGRRVVADRIEALRPTSGLRFEIGRIDGSIWSRATIRDFRIADPRGVFFESPAVELDWHPLEWLHNALAIDRLHADRARLYRLPRLNAARSRGPILPGFEFRVGALSIDRLKIDGAVSGRVQSGTVRGKADIRNGRALVGAEVRTNGGDALTLRLDAEPDRDRFDIAANLAAPSGGLFGAMLGTKRPVTAQIDGDGSWTKWRGTLSATAAGAPVAALALTARSGRYDLEGRLAPEILTPPRLMRLMQPAVGIKGYASLTNRRLDTHLSLTSASLGIGANGVLDLGSSAFENMRIDLRLKQPATLLRGMSGRNVNLTAMLNGGFSTARFDYLLTADRIAFDATGFDTVRASGQGRLGADPVRVPLRLTARRVTGIGDVAGGILRNLSVDGVLKVSGRTIAGDNLRILSDKLTSRVTLLVDLATGRFDVGIAGQLGRYFIPGLGIVDVKSTLRVVPGAGGIGTRIAGRGEARVRRLDNAFLASLTGGLPVIETGLERGTDGIIRFVGATLRAPALRLAGNGYRRGDGSFFFEGAGTQARYGPVRLRLDGPITRPRIDLVLARPMDSLGLRDVRANLVPASQGFTWRANGLSRIGPFTGNGAILLPKNAMATIQIASLDASGLRAAGALRVLRGGLEGRVALAGSGLTGTLDFAPAGTVQRVETHLLARDAQLAGPPPIAARRAKVDAVVLLDPRGIGMSGSIAGQGLRYGDIALASLSGSLELRGGSGTAKASFAGSRGRPFALQTEAQFTPGRVSIAGGGTIDRRPIRLASPALLTRSGAHWTLAPASITFAGGSARIGGTLGGGTTALDAALDRMPLSVLDIVYPGLGLGGSASGTAAFVLPANGAAPSGRTDLRLRGLSRAGLAFGPRPIDAGIAALLSGDGLVVRAIAASGGTTIARAQMRVAPLGRSGPLQSRIGDAPLFAQVRVNGPADTLWRLTGIEGIDVAGPVAIAADVTGTLSRPQLRGSVATDAMRIQSAVSGTTLTGMKARGSFAGSRLTVDSFAATAGPGTVSGSATFDLAAANGFAFEIRGDAQAAELIRRDDVAATVTGPFRMASDGATGVISGNFDVVRSAFQLGRANAVAAIPQLKVREVNRPADRQDVRAPPMRWSLDVKASAPNRLAVTGLGLDSEWGGDIALGGTLDAMRITGRLNVIRGGYEFAGKRFDLSRGTIRFQGASPPDPVLDIQADASLPSISAVIKVLGTASKPEISFTSTPALPQDELLSRLLFGTSITNLSAAEALQLASAVGSLRGGSGLDPINAVRRAVGLDRLRIVAADATTGAKTAIAAGKYITRRTYVEVVSDGQGYSATRIEFQITRWLSLLSSISTIGRQSAAVRISKDY